MPNAPEDGPSEKTLGDAVTFAGRVGEPRSDVSFGDERTIGDGGSSHDTFVDNRESEEFEKRYTILGPLGQGGMGAVLLALDNRLGRKVAIKRILGEAAGSRMAVARFLTEARAIAALNHPNIVQIHDYGRTHDGPFLSLEYVDGGSLLDRCKAGPVGLDDAIDLACQLCDGLAKAHELGVIHRDIKPANVLLTKEGVPKLTDFGLAKAQAGEHGHSITGLGVVLGTPDFMPAEQRRDAALADHRSDLWSLAATVYQMVTGRSPRTIRLNDLPSMLQDVLARALEEDKDARFQSAREFRDALKGSLRKSAATMAVEGGMCPECGTANDTSRKFCKKCAASLVAPCLSCGIKTPLWEEVCGECGAKQTPLVELRRGEMAAAQTRAEGLLGDLAFDEAKEIGLALRDEPNPRLGQLKSWAETFLGTVDRTREEQVARAAESLAEALKHEAAHDYRSAAFALKSVPASLRAAPLAEAPETIATVFDRVRGKQDECRRLLARIKKMVDRRNFVDLEHDVDRLLTLEPGRADMLQLRKELADRTIRLEEQRRAADLRHATENLEKACKRLREQIRAAVAAGRVDDILPAVEELIDLAPDDAEAKALRDSLIARERKRQEAAVANRAQLAAEREERLKRALLLEKSCRFTEATDLLARVSRTDEIRDRCERAAAQRAKAMDLLWAARPQMYGRAITAVGEYKSLIETQGFTDPEFAASLARVEQAHDAEEASRYFVRTMKVLVGGLVAALTTIFLGFSIRAQMRAAALQAAIDDCRWEEAVAIDPSNAVARRGRARLLVNSVGMRLVWLPGGSFTMGRPNDDQPAFRGHDVTLTRPFFIGTSEVTASQWRRVMGSLPSTSQDDDLPMVNVSWEMAAQFCRKLSALPDERNAGRKYRLPTEAEWEYACRAGTTTDYSFGADATKLAEYGWFAENSERRIQPVGMKKPNAWGLRDMHGNAFEWCADWFGDYDSGPASDPEGPPAGSIRVVRGGSYQHNAAAVRSVSRSGNVPTSREGFLGFRVAMSPATTTPPDENGR